MTRPVLVLLHGQRHPARYQLPAAASFLIYVTLVFIDYMREQADRRRIRSAFGQYLSPALVEQLAQSPDKLVLGGEERDMTMLFSDVRGFTTISETYKNDPQGLTQLMNRFLTPLTNAIIERKGTIDKYMGDAIMAFWNAPLDDAEHEINACRAALDMLRARRRRSISSASSEARDGGKPFIPIQIGIGINTGTCVVGNMGSDLRFDYSVLGDTVNLASRLEGQSKTYGVPIIIGAAPPRRRPGPVRRAGARPDHGQGQDRAGAHLYDPGRRRRRAAARISSKLRELNAAMLARYRKRDWSRRARGVATVPSTRRIILASTKSITYTWRASGRSRKRPRLTTGTACSHSKPSNFPTRI